MRRRSKFVSFGFVAAVLAVVGLWAGGRLGHSPSVAARTSPQLELISLGQVNEARRSAAGQERVAGVRAAVLPHHLVAQDLIARLVARLSSSRPKTIVIIGPDHQNLGPQRFTVSASDWQWVGERFATDQTVVEALVRRPNVAVAEPVIDGEHSVLVPLPFLASQFPAAQFVLVTVRAGYDRDGAAAIAETLDAVLGPDDLVVASVDFSHYQNLPTAQAEDERSLAALTSGDPDALGDIPVDSPMSLAVALRFAQQRGANALEVLEHGNSALILGQPEASSTTSYFTAVWR